MNTMRPPVTIVVTFDPNNLNINVQAEGVTSVDELVGVLHRGINTVLNNRKDTPAIAMATTMPPSRG